MKKQGTICICTYFRDMKKACTKDYYPMPFTNQFIDSCANQEALSFMDGLFG